jgi:hypothetical protein
MGGPRRSNHREVTDDELAHTVHGGRCHTGRFGYLAATSAQKPFGVRVGVIVQAETTCSAS